MAKSRDAFRTISEVADWLDTPAHVLRFWESRFTQVKPVKRAGGRRYYRLNDMMLLGGIKQLLHEDGITIKGVQKILREKGIKHVIARCEEDVDLAGQQTDKPADTPTDKPAFADSYDQADVTPLTSSPEIIPVADPVPFATPGPEAFARVILDEEDEEVEGEVEGEIFTKESHSFEAAQEQAQVTLETALPEEDENVLLLGPEDQELAPQDSLFGDFDAETDAGSLRDAPVDSGAAAQFIAPRKTDESDKDRSAALYSRLQNLRDRMQAAVLRDPR